jgi:hypothetical protein
LKAFVTSEPEATAADASKARQRFVYDAAFTFGVFIFAVWALSHTPHLGARINRISFVNKFHERYPSGFLAAIAAASSSPARIRIGRVVSYTTQYSLIILFAFICYRHITQFEAVARAAVLSSERVSSAALTAHYLRALKAGGGVAEAAKFRAALDSFEAATEALEASPVRLEAVDVEFSRGGVGLAVTATDVMRGGGTVSAATAFQSAAENVARNVIARWLDEGGGGLFEGGADLEFVQRGVTREITKGMEWSVSAMAQLIQAARGEFIVALGALMAFVIFFHFGVYLRSLFAEIDRQIEATRVFILTIPPEELLSARMTACLEVVLKQKTDLVFSASTEEKPAYTRPPLSFRS